VPGYREYAPADVHTLRFIRRARDLGFSMQQITELLTLWRDRSRASVDVKAVALGHVAALEAKIAELDAMKRALAHLTAHCHGDDRPELPDHRRPRRRRARVRRAPAAGRRRPLPARLGARPPGRGEGPLTGGKLPRCPAAGRP
jgi:MerR family transcriptional regulator, copper efflux regulator